jgi:hypothetical protein
MKKKGFSPINECQILKAIDYLSHRQTSYHKWGYVVTLLLITIIMSNILYTIAVILIIIWAIGLFGYAAGGLIHILLVIAIIAIILGVIRRA